MSSHCTLTLNAGVSTDPRGAPIPHDRRGAALGEDGVRGTVGLSRVGWKRLQATVTACASGQKRRTLESQRCQGEHLAPNRL